MKYIELLAPAGSMESLYAAVENGANAVYLGGNKFSARAYASNFDNETMEKAVDYAHSYGVKVYVTINTLLKESEIDEAVDYAKYLYTIGVDAILIQDVGLFLRLKEEVKNIELHASTQLTVHNGEGAKFFNEAGFKRIVLSRELSLKEVEYISKDLGIETEMFVHGALCVSYSGQCLMSSMIGGRSGNRGRCAQACRLPYKLEGESGVIKGEGYILSPKDISGYEVLDDIINTGTSSLKIEGRMKRPEYVAGVVAEYRRRIDNIMKNKDTDIKQGEKVLLKLFNREGFSKAFFYKNEGSSMMAYNIPKNSGTKLGSVIAGLVILEDDICKGDGVRIGLDTGFTVSKIVDERGNEVTESSKGSRVTLFPKKYKNGDVLYKTSDVSLNNELAETFRNKYSKKILLNARVKFKIGENIKISTEFEGKTFECEGDIVQQALKKPMTMEKINENLIKSGETPFKFDNIEYVEFEEGFMPVSSINALRREILDNVHDFVVSSKKRVIESGIKDDEVEITRESRKNYYIISHKDQLRAVKDSNINEIIVDVFKRGKDSLTINDLKELISSKSSDCHIFIRVPDIIKSEFDYIVKTVDSIIDFIDGICTSNIGILNKYKGRTKMLGDYKMNIMNSSALRFYGKYFDIPVLSAELTRNEIKEVCKDYNGNIGTFIYGRTELMVNEYCVVGSIAGGKSDCKECNIACEKDSYSLIDRMNEKFPVITDKFCRAHIYNGVSLNLIREKSELNGFGVNQFFVHFTNERYDECIDVINAVENGNALDGKYTKGHYRRGVE